MSKIVEQIRWQSKAAWVVFVIQSAAIIAVLGYADIADTWKVIGGALILIVEAFGIFNNPTNKDGF